MILESVQGVSWWRAIAEFDFGSTDGCVEFGGSRTKDGYGECWGPGRRKWKAHRLSYFLHRGALVPGMEIDHRACDNPPCVNPKHLVQTSRHVNLFRSLGSDLDHCPSGHPRSEHAYINSQGTLCCHECTREARHRYSTSDTGKVWRRRYREENIEELRAYDREWKRRKEQQATPEERAERLARRREACAKRLLLESPEHKAERLAKRRAAHAKRVSIRKSAPSA